MMDKTLLIPPPKFVENLGQPASKSLTIDSNSPYIAHSRPERCL